MWVMEMIGIYKIENLVNGKKYIGQSNDIEDRWRGHRWTAKITEDKASFSDTLLYRAMRKYGIENFIFSVIEECDIEDLNEKEMYWIKYYNTFVEDENSWGYNLTRGGDGVKRLSQKYINWFIELWKQGLTTGEISQITGKDKHIICLYLKLYEPTYTIEESKRRSNIKGSITNQKAIIQYDFLGRFIAEYKSLKEAKNMTGYADKSIIDSLKKRSKGTHKYYFIYKNDNQTEALKFLINMEINSFKPVLQFSKDGTFLNCFISVEEAAKQIKGSRTRISECCLHHCSIGNGFIWKYLTYDDIEKYNLKEIVPKFN